MFVFGHLGIGSGLVRPWFKTVPWTSIWFGTLLPDLIDKPLYYFLCLYTGKKGAELGLISSTRTLGHTALFCLFCSIFALLRHSKRGSAMTLGVVTHLALDAFVDYFGLYGTKVTGARALTFPFHGFYFPPTESSGLGEHVGKITLPGVWIPEAVGVLILVLYTPFKAVMRNISITYNRQ